MRAERLACAKAGWPWSEGNTMISGSWEPRLPGSHSCARRALRCHRVLPRRSRTAGHHEPCDTLPVHSTQAWSVQLAHRKSCRPRVDNPRAYEFAVSQLAWASVGLLAAGWSATRRWRAGFGLLAAEPPYACFGASRHADHLRKHLLTIFPCREFDHTGLGSVLDQDFSRSCN